ncbi:MAG: asparagine synthase C-terminal domain-containing protein [Candidatus ainarchaeum sp.]|nr:asparagine synthase C-terminal domain-containing protein [Candidatus ainarchaeum sp.]
MAMDLLDALRAAVSDSVRGKRAAGVLFSGGLDSSVLAFLAGECNPATLLYAAGVKGSEDLAEAGAVARLLGMELREVVLGDADLARLFREAGEITGEKNVMKLELALALLALCGKAKADGVKTLLSGSGAEELFLGYAYHLAEKNRGGDLEALRKSELAGLRGKDLSRGEKVAERCGVTLLLPFLDARVVSSALSVPAQRNFGRGENKLVLRDAARRLGVPEKACSRPKRAMQYGSGVHARLRALLRTNAINP